MWPMHDFPFLISACSCRSSLFTAVVMRWRMMGQKSLLMIDSIAMPLQLLHSDRLPFFVNFMIVPLFQASDITSLSQTFWGHVEDDVKN